MSPQKEHYSIAMETSPPNDNTSKAGGGKVPIYTHGSYWGGPQLPYWLFLVFTALPFTGFFGIDHLLFRSPTTAFLKGLVNMLTLGLWYFYDIIQAFHEREFIEKYGLSKPVTGPAGLALDYFTGVTSKEKEKGNQSGGGDEEKKDEKKKNPFLQIAMFIGYIFTILLPFGISNFVAGDMKGGGIKLILSILFPFSLFWLPWFGMGSLFELYRAVFTPTALFEKGTYRIPPLGLVMEDYGFAPNVMNPKAIQEFEKKEAEDTLFNTIFNGLFKPVMDFAKPLLASIPFMQVLDTTKCAVVPPAKKTIEAAQTAGQGIIALSKTIPQIASKTTETLTAFTDPAAIKKLAEAQAMKGGGLSGEGSYDWIVVTGLAILLMGGFGATVLRKYMSSTKNDEPSRKTSAVDAPPEPGRL